MRHPSSKNLMPIRIIKHEAVPQCGSFKVRFDDGRPSQYFYLDDNVGRRLRPEMMTGEQTLQAAKEISGTSRRTRAER
jgi:hypothetical protein